MKIVARIIAAMLFVVFFGFALKNTHEVSLRFFMDYEWHGPLVLLLLAFLVVGAVLGVLAMTPTVFRYRRELSRQKNIISSMQKENEAQQMARTQAPPPDSVPDR
ncbi:MAG: LapA family protein [Burkholderiaceae bacterium]|nr:LapA family protein [Burkholderiaceae bacterium]